MRGTARLTSAALAMTVVLELAVLVATHKAPSVRTRTAVRTRATLAPAQAAYAPQARSLSLGSQEVGAPLMAEEGSPPLMAGAEWERIREEAVLRRIDALRDSIERHRHEIEELQTRLGTPARRRSRLRDLLAPLHTSLGVFARRAARTKDTASFLRNQTVATARVLADLMLARDGRDLLKVLPHSHMLVSHTPAIYAQIDHLATHVPGIVGILDTHLPSIEPHLDAILERFDDIEPHLPWVLEHIDEVAPYCGTLLEHIDSLLLYADQPDDAGWADKLVPYIPYIVPCLDELEPHLPYLRPHLPKIYPYLPKLAPYIQRFARADAVFCSKNADVLLFYFAWVLKVPLLHNIFRVPGVPRLCAWAARRLPRRWARGPNCVGVECSVEGLYESGWNRLLPDDGWQRDWEGAWF